MNKYKYDLFDAFVIGVHPSQSFETIVSIFKKIFIAI